MVVDVTGKVRRENVQGKCPRQERNALVIWIENGLQRDMVTTKVLTIVKLANSRVNSQAICYKLTAI